MNTILRFLEVFALGTWLGGILYLSFAVAPGAFGTLGSRDQAGAVVGMALGRLHLLGLVAGIVFLVARIALAKSLSALGSAAALLVVLMLVLTIVSQYSVSPRMANLRAEMGSVERTPAESPLRTEFDRLHHWSVRLEAGVLLAGLAALLFAIREKA